MDFDWYIRAAAKGDIEVFKGIQAHYLSQIVALYTNDTILHVHIRSAEMTPEFVKEIVDMCPSLLLQVNLRYNTPLHVAAQIRRCFPIVEVLLKCARDQPQELENEERVVKKMLAMKNFLGNTALHEAVLHGNTEMVEVLAREADPDISYSVNNNGRTPLHLAVERGYYDMVVSIINSDTRGTHPTYPILHTYFNSVFEPSTEFVQKILDNYPFLLLQRNCENDTPLHVAAECRQTAILEYLLKRVGDLDPELESKLRAEFSYLNESLTTPVLEFKEYYKYTAAAIALTDHIRVAATSGDFGPFKEKSKDDIEKMADLSKNSILHVHIISSKTLSNEFVKSVLDKCPSLIFHVNIKGDTPLHNAARRAASSDIAEILFKYASDQTQDLESEKREKRKMLTMKNDWGNTALHEAVLHGNTEVVNVLAKEADRGILYSVNKSDRTPLQLAVERENYDVVDAIMNSGIRALDPEFYDESDSLLHVAAKCGQSAVVEFLLESGRAQQEKKNKFGNTALHEAVRRGKVEVVEALTGKGCPDISYFVNEDGQTPLYLAVSRRDEDMMLAIIRARKPGVQESRTELNEALISEGTQSEDTILHLHIKSSPSPSKEFVEEIIGIRPSLLQKCNADSDTPLHVAAKLGNSAILEVLVKCARGQPQEPEASETANCKMLMERKNNQGKTTLDEAVERGNLEIVKILIEESNLDYYSSFDENIGSKILYLAAERGDHKIVSMVAKLSSHQSAADEGSSREKALHVAVMTHSDDPDVIAPSPGDTILHFHLKSSQLLSIEFVEKVVDICPSLLGRTNAKGDTPLHVAAKCGHCTVVEVLLRRAQPSDRVSKPEAYLEMQNNEGNTALHEAVRHGKIGVVKLLAKEQSAFPYRPNKAGETPLYLAAARGYCEMVSAILRSSKPVAHDGPNGLTALHAAVMNSSNPGLKSVWHEDPNGMKTSTDYSNDSGRIIKEICETNKVLTKATDAHGWTPLHYAAYHGLNDKVALLLKYDKSAAYIADKDRKMTALHMAACQGHKDTIENIISQCVECCEIVDRMHWNVLHYAVLSLSKNELIDLLTNPLVASLVNEKDVSGNTPLHIRAAAYRDSFFHIGNYQAVNSSNISVERMLKRGSHKLEDEIQMLFEDVGDGQYQNGVIRERKDDDYFKLRGERRKKYYDELKETKASHLLVSTLIATVTFAAAFTIPGGYNNEKGLDQGTAVLNRNSAFQAFIITNTIAMTLSLSAVFVHFIMSFEKFQANERLLTLALWLTISAMGTVVVAFVTGIYSILAPSLWLAAATCSLGLSSFLLVIYALKQIYWSVILRFRSQQFLSSIRKLFRSSACLLPTHFKKGN